MKSPVHFKRLRNLRWPVFPPATIPFALLLILVMASACTTLRNDQPKDALYTQIYTDMMYGADDYFGQNMDLAYADGVVPTVVQPVFQTATITPETTQRAVPVPASAPAAAPVVVVQPVVGGGSGGGGGGGP